MTRIRGLETFVEDLDDFADDLEEIADEVDEAIDEGTRKTSLQVERTAKRLAPVDDGELRADIQAIQIAAGLYSVGTVREYGPSVEYGSRPHPITPNGPYPLVFYWEREGRWVATYEVEHPGTPSQPFLRPALNAHRSDLVENISQEIEELIDSQL